MPVRPSGTPWTEIADDDGAGGERDERRRERLEHARCAGRWPRVPPSRRIVASSARRSDVAIRAVLSSASAREQRGRGR